MKIVKLIIGVLVSMAVLNIGVEILEFFIVKSVSAKSAEYLSSNQTEYFDIRNQTWILVLKAMYTFLIASLASWLGSYITKYFHKPFIIIMIITQSLSFLYAMLFSEFKDTLSVSFWLLLLILVLSGVVLGYRLNLRWQKNKYT